MTTFLDFLLLWKTYVDQLSASRFDLIHWWLKWYDGNKFFCRDVISMKRRNIWSPWMLHCRLSSRSDAEEKLEMAVQAAPRTCRTCKTQFTVNSDRACVYHPESFSGETAQRWLPPGMILNRSYVFNPYFAHIHRRSHRYSNSAFHA